MSRNRTTFITAAILATGLALAGCSSTSAPAPGVAGSSSATGSSPAANASFNAADVMFVSGMVPHHEQAVSMSDTLLTKNGIDPVVLALATTIKAEQAPEIATMKSWLSKWKVSADSGMGHGMGMMSDGDMSSLDSASGSAAAKLYLTQMIQHHEGAIGMAKTESSAGKSADALALAKSIIASQSGEVQTMKDLLGTL